jgi:phospholipase C
MPTSKLVHRAAPVRALRFVVGAGLAIALTLPGAHPPTAGARGPLDGIEHLIVIYQENHSFDNYFGTFPGADGLANAGSSATQVDKSGAVYPTLPQPLADLPASQTQREPDPRFPVDLPNRPFLINEFVSPDERGTSMVHVFWGNQYQINGGAMNAFVAWTDAGGMTMGYWDISALPLWQLAREYTLADHFFQAAFGGSFLNHQWLICACTPTFSNAPANIVASPYSDDPDHFQDRQVTPDGYVVNTSFSVNSPHPSDARPETLVPNQTAPTIGDRLSAAGVDWAWYAGGWRDALSGNPRDRFQFHHQPFVFYANYADGTPARAAHLKDEQDFFDALDDGMLPAVSFIKPVGLDNEHPNYTTPARGQQHVADIVRRVQNSAFWPSTAIIITYDEFGGSWDHVSPPVIDRWGPGPRIPAVIVSPWAKKGYVDHTRYDTTAILRLIELRWGLEALGARDAAAADLTNAFDVAAPSAPAQLPTK